MKMGVEDFAGLQFFFVDLAQSLSTHFKIETMTIQSTLEAQQKEFVNEFKVKKTEEMNLLLGNELWQHA